MRAGDLGLLLLVLLASIGAGTVLMWLDAWMDRRGWKLEAPDYEIKSIRRGGLGDD